MINKKIFYSIILLSAIIFFSGFSSAYMVSNPSYFPSSSELQTTSQIVCQPGQDFVIQLTPFGCTPAIVRSDLLEENDVPVLCQLGATKINPLIDVTSIDSISFSGQYSKEVSGVGFYPAKAALGIQGNLNSPVLNNIGYVVIMLKKQKNESAMPNYVAGNLTAKVSYNIDKAFGIGDALFYLPEFATESEWQTNKYQFSFWNGKGYLKADDINANGATISLYTESGKLSDVNLQVGQTSNSLYLPGFECRAGLKLKLESLDNSDTRAKLRINADVTEVIKGQKFLDNKCTIQDLQNNGIVQKVTIKCQEDSGASTFLLAINPSITLNVGGADKEVGLGDWLYDSGDKSVYLGYIGMSGSSLDSKNLFVYLFAKPEKKNNLTSDELFEVNLLVNDLTNAGIKPTGIIDKVSDSMKSFVGLTNRVGKYVASGQLFNGISFGDKTQSFLGKPVYITSFSGAQDIELNPTVKEQYNSAKQDYETIKTQYASEPYPLGSTTYGEEALYNEITLAFDANQKETAFDLCTEFTKDYPHSKKDLTIYCSYQLSSSQTTGVYVTINKQIRKISFDGIYEPTFDEYGVVIRADTPRGIGYFSLEKNNLAYLDSSGNNFIQLISINSDNSANIQIGVTTTDGTANKIVQLTENSQNDFAKGYTFTLTKINSKKIAKVSVISNINDAGTTADFSFKIGIEKRAIILSPDQIRQQITDLNKGISKWQNVSDVLGNVTQILKTSCIAAGIALVAKNFLLNAGGAGIARTSIMSGTGGWTQKCTDLVASKTYISLDECFLKNADKIDAEVNTVSKVIEAQNAQKKLLEKEATTPGILGEQVVNTDKYTQQNIPQVNSYLKQSLPISVIDPSGKGGQAIDMNNLLTNVITLNGSREGMYTLDQLNDIELWTRVSKDTSASPELIAIANARLYSDLLTIQTNSVNYAQTVAVASSLNINPNQVTSLNTQNEKSKVMTYEGLTDNGKPIAVVQTLPDGKVYKVVLNNSMGTSNLPIVLLDGKNLAIYDYSSGALITDPSVTNQFKSVYFQKFDSTSYKNTYKDAKLQYYETEPYKGMPAIIPFDLVNGWYAATKPIVSNTATNTYEANGRVSSFYVCNVGANQVQEFQTGGDDICEMINTGTGQAYNQFPGLSASEATTIINKANQAIEAASKAYASGISGKVNILGNKIDVGIPAVSVPQFQCQDFMSPKDCLLLFNLCDPVICPSSRCNLGGTYPVKDVIQSGIIGSIALCFPNVREGIILPVCLTGIQAGIDGFLSVQKSYRDCLSESLATGKMIGICDEVYSIYLCDFFWKQALPIANLAIPRIIGAIAGQNVRGGGEYLGVANAWSTAQKSFSYFINSYGINSRNAFTSRSTDVIQNEVCKLYVSAVVPSGADLLNTLTQPDSPPQFTGHFEEMTFSTATVPPTSQYKVYYHIYAGKDSGAYYQVYLKGDASSSYYQDTSQTVMIDSGYVAVGSQVDETKNILATSGYKKLCINVNGQEECGFSSVSTSFGVNYLTDLYVGNQANQTNINSDSECISDYTFGIIRICATADPGQGTDPNSGTSNARWKQVGNCDTQNMKCWIDTQSVQNTIKSTTIENATISSISDNYLNLLANQPGYLTKDEFSSVLKEIQSEKNSANRITLIDNVIGKILLSNDKSQLLLLRGNAYADIFRILFANLPKPVAPVTITAPYYTPVSSPASTTAGTETLGAKTSMGYAIWKAAKTLVDNNWDEYRSAKVCGTDDSCIHDNVCTRFVLRAMINAGVKSFLGADGNCLQSVCTIDSAGAIIFNQESHSGWEAMVNLIFTFKNNPQDWVEVNFNRDSLIPGDIVMLGSKSHNKDLQHIIIFDSYTSDSKSIKGFGDPGIGCRGVWSGLTCIGITYSIPSKIETYPIKSDNWYIYRAFRYIGDFSPASKAMAEAAAPKTETTTPSAEIPASEPTTNTTGVSDSVSRRNTIGEKVYAVAMDFANSAYDEFRVDKKGNKSYDDVSGKFVAHSLVEAGANGISVTSDESVETLISDIEKNIAFTEIDVKKLKIGDIVILGFSCDVPSLAGIVALVPDDYKKIYYYTDTGKLSKVGIQNLVFTSAIAENFYFLYKAYRYTGDLSSSDKTGIAPSRDAWTLITALNQVNKLSGSYTSNKIFVDQLIYDEVLTEKECSDVRGTSSFVGSLGGAVLQKDMAWLKKLLLVKCGQDELCKKTYLMK